MPSLRITRAVLLHQAITMTNIIGILLALSILSDAFGIINLSFLHLLSVYLLLGISLLNIPLKSTANLLWRPNRSRNTTSLGIILLIIAFLILIFGDGQPLWLASVSVLIFGLVGILQANSKPRKEFYLLGTASFGYAIVFLLIQSIPILWYFFQQSSLSITHFIGVIIGTPLLLGPTADGLWILLLFLVVLFSGFLVRTKSRKNTAWFLECTTGLIIIWILYIGVLDVMPSSTNTEPLRYHILFFSFGLLPIIVHTLRDPMKEQIPSRPFMKRKERKLVKNGAVWVAVLLFLSISLLTVAYIPLEPVAKNTRVLFYGEHMLGTWDFPEYGKYGRDGVGMFGLWPVYLTTLGYEPELLVRNTTEFLTSLRPPSQNITSYLNLTDYVNLKESPTLDEHLLGETDILVITNLNISLTQEEQMLIWDYVNGGGSLLVLGDHTNVGGVRGPLNELLRPVGISFRFDAALPLDETFKWLTCTNLLHHPITIPLSGIDEIQYGVGASLNITSPAYPIVIGTYALSDQGNQSSQDLAYLGDYTYNKGEQLGDVILVAASYYGAGKVLVFGDTSSFQNPALPFSYPFLQSTFSWLSTRQNGNSYFLQTGFSILILILAILLFYFSKKTEKLFTLFPLVLCGTLLLTTTINPVLFTQNTQSESLVAIDASHTERFSQEPFTDDSVNGLIMNLQRNNLLPILVREFSSNTVSSSKILIFIAPTTSFTHDQIMMLSQYMEKGGFIILATGFDDEDASLPLLQHFNISVESTPLGPVPYVEGNISQYQNEPRFVDSWPLSFPEPQSISYYNFTWDDSTYHLVILEKYGKGGLLVIGDSQFILDKNIESIYDYWPGNIIFLKHLINEIQTMEE